MVDRCLNLDISQIIEGNHSLTKEGLRRGTVV